MRLTGPRLQWLRALFLPHPSGLAAVAIIAVVDAGTAATAAARMARRDPAAAVGSF